MVNGALILSQYSNTYDVIMRLTADVTHEESLRQWSFNANCLNWLLGHVTVARLNLLAMIGDREPVWSFAQARRYIPGTPPITGDAPEITHFDELSAAFTRSHKRFSTVLQLQPPEAFVTQIEEQGRSVGEELLYYAQHEAFHAGQMEICRAMLGKSPVLNFE